MKKDIRERITALLDKAVGCLTRAQIAKRLRVEPQKLPLRAMQVEKTVLKIGDKRTARYRRWCP